MRDISKINGRINIRPSAIHPRTYARGIPRNSLNEELKDFNKKFDEQEEANSVGLMNQGAMTELRRDRIDDASVNYLNEQKA